MLFCLIWPPQMSLSLQVLITYRHAYFLREVANEIAEPLTKLYNESLHTGIIPKDWKQSHITPIHKGGSTGNPSNYHPIAVVPRF